MSVRKKIFLIIVVTVLTLIVILYSVLNVVDMSRHINTQGQTSMWYLLISLLVAVMAIGMITYLLIDRLILSRLARFSDSVTHIGEKKDFSARVSVKGNDELTNLARQINAMLKALEQSQLELWQSEEQYRSIFNEGLTGNYVSNPAGQILLCNTAFARIFGYEKPEEIICANATSLYHDKVTRGKFLIDLQEQKKLEHYEYELVDRYGRKVTVVENANGTFDNNGELIQMQGYLFDITERKQAEEKLRESEEKYRLVFENSPVGILHFNEFGVITACNESLVKIIDTGENILIGQNLMNVPNKELVEGIKKVISGKPACYEGYYHSVTSGKTIPVNASCAPILLHDNTVIGGVAMVEDITERKRSEDALYQEKKRLSVTLSSIGDAVIAVDLSGIITVFNPVAETLSGWPAKEALGRNIDLVFNTVNEYTGQTEENPVCKVLNQNQSVVFAYHIALIARDGTKRSITNSAAPICDAEGNMLGAILVFRDVTMERKREAALKASEERFRLIAENAKDIIFRLQVEPERKFEYISPAVTAITGNTPEDFYADPHLVYRLVYPDDLDILKGIVDGKQDLDSTITLRWVCRDGRVIWIEQRNVPAYAADGRLVAIEGIVRDITVRKQMEQKLRHLSLHDPLTGLYNRAYFELEIQRLEKNACYPIGIILCDVDGLKLVNDTMGHDAGDRVLLTTAAVIRKALFDDDVVARVGGDEFAILLPRSGANTIKDVCSRIMLAVEQYNLSNSDFLLSISAGFAVCSAACVSLRDTFKEADNNMYKEKLHRKQSARSAIVQTLMKALEARDFITEGHADRIQDLIAQLGRYIGLPEPGINDLRLLAQFHDIGKVGIPDQILFKPGPLNQEEAAEMRRHCEIGHRIALAAPDLTHIADWILKHHEWWNGQGYPLGLKEEEIPLECRILAIADAYDAMTSDRPYRKAMPHNKAMEELERCAGKQFDPLLVKSFINVLEQIKFKIVPG